MGERARARGDDGAALVEFALVLPILAMFLFGTISAGMAWNENLAMAQGARMGGRYAVTLPTRDFDSLDAYLDDVETQVVNASEGAMDTTAPDRIVCVAYVHPNGSTTLDQTRRRYESGTTVTRGSSTCFTDGLGSDDTRIQVMVEKSATLQAGIYSRTVTLHQQVVFRYEVTNGL